MILIEEQTKEIKGYLIKLNEIEEQLRYNRKISPKTSFTLNQIIYRLNKKENYMTFQLSIISRDIIMLLSTYNDELKNDSKILNDIKFCIDNIILKINKLFEEKLKTKDISFINIIKNLLEEGKSEDFIKEIVLKNQDNSNRNLLRQVKYFNNLFNYIKTKDYLITFN